jgi:hypothetical protein
MERRRAAAGLSPYSSQFFVVPNIFAQHESAFDGAEARQHGLGCFSRIVFPRASVHFHLVSD